MDIYMKMNRLSPILAAALFPTATHALINPSLQANDLFERYNHVVVATVSSVDEESGTMELSVTAQEKGELPSDTITLSFPPVEEDADFDEEGKNLEAPEIGQVVVAFAASRIRRREKDVMIYVGDRQWHEVELDPENPVSWKWIEAAEETMVGTFNGQAERFAEIVSDIADGSLFFPARVWARFQEDLVVAETGEPFAGVAIHDLDADGRADLIASGEGGIRIFLQTGGMEFTDSTEALGLSGVAATTVSVADADADGRPDLLLGTSLYRNAGEKFEASAALPDGSGENLKVSAFSDLNADGLPDILLSLTGGGLRAFLNPGEMGKPFVDATADLGLDTQPEGDGYITLGDWNLDGRTDIFYAQGRGILFLQSEKGSFTPGKQKIYFNFKGGPDLEPGLTGAGTFAPVWSDETVDLVVPEDSFLTLATKSPEGPASVTGFGNEIALATDSQSATLAHDLDMDGYLDLFTITRDPKGKNSYHTNRGFGSFMKSDLYEPGFIPGTSYSTGAGGVAAGDINGDGADDLLLGGLAGRLVVVLNDCLSLRKDVEHPIYHLAKLMETGIASITLNRPLGILGARLTVLDSDGETAALRFTNHPVLTGCGGSATTNIALRDPGTYQLEVRYTDGETDTVPFEIKPGERTKVRVGGK